MKRGDRDRLLKLCRDGYPLLSALAKSGLSRRAVEAACEGEGFKAELDDALEIGRGLRAGVMIEAGMANRDARAIQAGLEQLGEGSADLVRMLERAALEVLRAAVSRLSVPARERLMAAAGVNPDGSKRLTLLEWLTALEDGEEPDPPLGMGTLMSELGEELRALEAAGAPQAGEGASPVSTARDATAAPDGAGRPSEGTSAEDAELARTLASVLGEMSAEEVAAIREAERHRQRLSDWWAAGLRAGHPWAERGGPPPSEAGDAG